MHIYSRTQETQEEKKKQKPNTQTQHNNTFH